MEHKASLYRCADPECAHWSVCACPLPHACSVCGRPVQGTPLFIYG